MDVANYFQSTTWSRVYWFFNKRLNASEDVAWTLATLCTIDGHLPTGGPVSPILAYYAHEDAWLRVNEIAEAAGCRFSLYMDDVTISGERVPDRVGWAAKQAVHAVGLRLKASKERRYSTEGVVTGVVVTATGVRAKRGSHLKLHQTLTAYQRASSPEAKSIVSKKLVGIRAQHLQIAKALG